jgi:hypothetical protein
MSVKTDKLYSMSVKTDKFYGSPQTIDDIPMVIVYGGDFRQCVLNMHKAITKYNAWKEVAKEPEDGKGFMYQDAQWQREIETDPLVEECGHSGATLGYCWRLCQEIAQDGWEKFCEKIRG